MKSCMYLLFFCALHESGGQLHREPKPQLGPRQCPKTQLKYTCHTGQVCFDRAPKRFRCLQYGESEVNGVYAISRCNSKWNGSIEIKEKCEGPTDFSDPISAAPVTSRTRGVTYRNMYCAECNHAKKKFLESFLHKPLCEHIKDFPKKEVVNHLTYDQTKNAWSIRRSDGQGNPTFYQCQIHFAVPDYLRNSVRSCVPDIVSECDSDWKDEHVRRLCGQYTSIVYSHGCFGYENPHCAVCNRVTTEYLFCEDMCYRKKPLSFGDLIDINRPDDCPEFHLYDPYKKKCRKLSCILPGYVVRGNKCVKGQ